MAEMATPEQDGNRREGHSAIVKTSYNSDDLEAVMPRINEGSNFGPYCECCGQKWELL